MPCWYYEEKELRNTPSIQDGISYEDECRYRKEGARFIIDVGTKMDLVYTTMATGVVYFHRFYMFHSFKTFPRYVTACCCLFLAGKVEETPKKCKDIIKTAKSLLPENKLAQFGDDPREEVMILERILLQTIKFDLQVEHPYSYLLKYAKCLKGDKAKLQKMVQMAWTFINDSLCTTLCLQWEPEIIAVALMYLAGKLSTFEVVDWNGRQPKHLRWWDMFLEDVEMDLLEAICHQVLDLYSSSNKAGQPDSPPMVPSKEVVREKFSVPKPIDVSVHSNNGKSVSTPPKSAKKDSNPAPTNGRIPPAPELAEPAKQLEMPPHFAPFTNFPPGGPPNYPQVFPTNMSIPPPIVNPMNHIPPPIHHLPPAMRPMPTTPTSLQQIQPFGSYQNLPPFPGNNVATPTGMHRPYYPPPS